MRVAKIPRGFQMHLASFLPSGDTIILIVPFLGLMAMTMLRLDEHLASPKVVIPRRRKFCEVAGDGQISFSDPDGRPCGIRIRR